MLFVGSAAVPLTGGLELPFGSRVPVADGLVDVADELYARALVIDDTFRQIALVGVDLLTLDTDLVRAAGHRVYEAVRIPPHRLYVVPTGTMTAPLTATLPGFPPRPESYAAYVAEQIASAVIYAARMRAPAALGWARGDVPLAHGWPGPLVLRAELVDGGPLALLAELPTLPTATGRVISADYPGEAARVLARLEPAAGYVGLLGPAAGAAPLAAEPAAAGARLAALAYAASQSADPDPDLRIGVTVERVELPFEVPDVDQAADRFAAAEAALDAAGNPLAERIAASEFERARLALGVAEAGQARDREVSLTALSLGDGVVIGSPLLLSPAAARLAQTASAWGDRTLLAAGVNGVLGVLTTPAQRLPDLENWYAALPFGPDAAERYAAAVGRATERLQREAPGPDTEDEL